MFSIADLFIKNHLSHNLFNVDTSFLQLTSEKIMSKGQNSKKEDKKKPAMTPKEKKEKKKSKK